MEDSDAEYHLIELAVQEVLAQVRHCRVSDGEEAIRFLQRATGHEIAPRPDLILLDVNLPKSDGFQVLAAVRATHSLSSIPVVMFTSSSRDSERKRALALGAEDFISKPATLDELIQALKTICERFLVEH